MAQLTTHILDTANGRPAGNVAIRLYALGSGRTRLASAVSNVDGRTDVPLLKGDALRTGEYELEFDVGLYFAATGVATGEPPFLNTIVIRFAMQSGQNYHVPLLVSPWSYSTYRGS
ncbi:MAG: hydroxyisourate hydrolase [Gammaproteobacteria bacterium]|nr:hydroxyisourate hydrolase [Gammaproteobacteria bacterium]MDH5322389.1 hydroxyisourate hydrolase [Gammaproteobacteria bacterium]